MNTRAAAMLACVTALTALLACGCIPYVGHGPPGVPTFEDALPSGFFAPDEEVMVIPVIEKTFGASVSRFLDPPVFLQPAEFDELRRHLEGRWDAGVAVFPFHDAYETSASLDSLYIVSETGQAALLVPGFEEYGRVLLGRVGPGWKAEIERRLCSDPSPTTNEVAKSSRWVALDFSSFFNTAAPADYPPSAKDHVRWFLTRIPDPQPGEQSDSWEFRTMGSLNLRQVARSGIVEHWDKWQEILSGLTFDGTPNSPRHWFYVDSTYSYVLVEVCDATSVTEPGLHLFSRTGEHLRYPWFDPEFADWRCQRECTEECHYTVSDQDHGGTFHTLFYSFSIEGYSGHYRVELRSEQKTPMLGAMFWEGFRGELDESRWKFETLRTQGLRQAADPAYGYSRDNPIKIGVNGASFWWMLKGPRGQRVWCTWKRSEWIWDQSDIAGVLNIAACEVKGSDDVVDLYFDTSSYEEPRIPVGFTFPKESTGR